MKTLLRLLTLEHFVDSIMIIFAVASVGNIAEYMSGHNHNPFTAYGVAGALGLGLVAISVLLARISPSDRWTFGFMLVATLAVALLSGAVQSMAYLEHRPDDKFAAYLFGFGFPLVGECLLALAMSIYNEAQRKKRLAASDDAMNERINHFLNRSLDDVDLSKMTVYIEKQVGLIVRNKIDGIVSQRLTQAQLGRSLPEVGRSLPEVGPTSPNQDAQDADITTKAADKLVELNEAKQRKVGERRDAVVRIIAAVGPMGAPDLVEKLAEDCGIKASAQTVRDDCAALVDDGRLTVVGRKWDIPRIVAVHQPEEIGISANGQVA